MILPPEKLVPVANLESYTWDPTPYDWGGLLAPFSPPLPTEGQVIVVSFFGDVFVEDGKGEVWWVNGLEARVDKIAPTRDAFLQRIADEHLVMLKTKLLEAMIVENKLLATGMLYGLKVPRAEGGKYSPDNVGTASIAQAFAFMGDQFRRAQPPPEPAPAAAPKTVAATKPVAALQPAEKSKKKGWFN